MAVAVAGLAIAGVGLTISAVQTIFTALQCSELKEFFGPDLENLQRMVKTIQAALVDAESKQANGLELTAQEHDFIEKVNDAVYDADDLLDAYVTRAKQKQTRMEGGEKFSTKVRGLGSRLKSLITGSPEAKKIVKKLNEIGRDAQTYKFKYTPNPIMREETCSKVNENHIVGRKVDQREIVNILLKPIVQGELPVLAIVGMGGMGKTAVAQLVYNDPRIVTEFSLRFWVCVSDQGGKQLNVTAILADIYRLVNPKKYADNLKLEGLVQELGSKLDQHNYLVVLDDLWNENSDKCLSLVNKLTGLSQRGCRIVVTTRSLRTANAIRSSHPYKLDGLSEDNSWNLFKMEVGKEIKEDHDLFEIGKDIVKKCVNLPLAIKVVGSLLYDVDENEWQSFQKSRLIDIKKDDDDNGIMQILKFSYFYLSPSLKSCFTYCALFPKDFKIPKGKLISMWMAHEYVKDEAEAENHFQILVQRSFFQDMEEYNGRMIIFKIHDLMHDMAQEVSGKEIYIANSSTTQLDKKIRHFYDGAPETCIKGFVTHAKSRSYVHGGYFFEESDSNIQFLVGTLLAKCRHLRVLDLSNFGIRELPDAIGELLHLRYLDLSENKHLEKLPDALTKLINLQFLNVDCYYSSSSLKELPRDFKKLVNLRTLYVPNSLEYMPIGMASMTSLTKLNKFIVGHRKPCLKQEDLLEDLRAMRNLKGSLEIRFIGDYKRAKEYCRGGGGYICNTQHLNSISIRWYHERNVEGGVGNYDEDLLEDLQPHRNLKELEIYDYSGVRLPSWAREDSLTTSLPNLVKIELHSCNELKKFPLLGRLLKILHRNALKNVEYVENRRSTGVGCSNKLINNVILPLP